jgi:isoleucyl-tRNA synthetase
MQRVADSYRKIRNSLFRYVLSNLYDFDPQKNAVTFDQLDILDQYMLRQTVAMAADVTRWYDEFTFHKIYHRINDFCVVELSAFYFDVLKDRLYTSAPNSLKRRAAQTAIWRIGEALVRLLAPITSFTCDEVWQYLPKLPDRSASVHLANFPSASDILGGSAPPEDAKQAEDWKTLLAVRTEVLKALEEARQSKLIGGANLEAQVTVTAAEPVFSVLSRYSDRLRFLFIVSAVTLQQGSSGNGTGGVAVQVSKADGKKCDRCWNYSIHVGDDADYPTVCERCSAVLKEIEGSHAGKTE